MSAIMTNEWQLLKRQFDALLRGESPRESVEDMLDVEFRRRFTELINQTAQRNSTSTYNWPPTLVRKKALPKRVRANSVESPSR
jgi:hypothetical protein